MKLTSGATQIVLVDPAVGGFQPIPSVKLTQMFESYKIEGGTTKYVPHGNDQPAVSPAVVIIDQVDDVTAQAMLVAVRALVADPLNQPITVQWNDLIPSGPWDGAWWIMDVSAPETTTEFPGRIKIALSMAPATGMPVALGPDESFAGATDVSLSSPVDGDVVSYRISDAKWTNQHLFGVWRALWLAGTAYVVNDLVYYSGSSYVSILAGTGQQPDTATTYWSLVAQKGATGSTGVTGAAGTMSASGTVTTSAVGDTGVPGSASTASAGDHKHGREAFVAPTIALASAAAAGAATTPIRSDSTIAAFDTTAPGSSAVGDAAAVGAVNFASRRDHKHGREAFATPAVVLAAAAAAGAATTLMRSDATVAAFDTTVPAAVGATAATGSVAFAARRDHVHPIVDLTYSGHIISTASGTPATSTLGANVTSATFTGNDTRGTIAIVMAGALAANTKVCTATFATTYGATGPQVTLVDQTSAVGLTIVNSYVLAQSTGVSFDIAFDQALGTGTYTIDYIVIG